MLFDEDDNVMVVDDSQELVEDVEERGFGDEERRGEVEEEGTEKEPNEGPIVTSMICLVLCRIICFYPFVLMIFV